MNYWVKVMQDSLSNSKRSYEIYVYLILSLLCFLLKFLSLISTHFPLPTPDSPYNALQIKFLCERGVLYFDAPIFSFAFASLINMIIKNPILSSKLATSILLLLLVFL